MPSAESATDLRVSHPPGFPVRLGGVNELHAAFLIESRTRCHGWGRAVGNPGSFAFFAKGGIPRILIPTVAWPTLCKERKGWATHPPVQDSVPKGRLRVAQHAVLGRVYERGPVPKGRLRVAQHAVLGRVYERGPVPKGRLRVAQYAVLGRVYERGPVPKGRLRVAQHAVLGRVYERSPVP